MIGKVDFKRGNELVDKLRMYGIGSRVIKPSIDLDYEFEIVDYKYKVFKDNPEIMSAVKDAHMAFPKLFKTIETAEKFVEKTFKGIEPVSHFW